MVFWEYVSVQSAGEYIKYTFRWKQWPMLYIHSCTRPLHAPLSTIGEVFVGLVPK